MDPSTRRAIYWRLIPLLLVCYVVAYIDRVNVGFAALHMNQAIGLSTQAYGLGAGLFFLSYALLEIPSNLLLVRVGARRWIARIMVSWGLLSVAMLFASGPVSFCVLRIALGAAEAGFFPGVVFYLSQWFPPAERARAFSGFTLAMPVAPAIGGPIAGALLTLDGSAGLAGWQWLFLIEGLPAVVLGIAVYVCLPDGPAQARWLPVAARERLIREIDSQENRAPVDRSGGAWSAMQSPAIWCLAVSYLLASMATYGLTLWLPQILHQFSGMSDLGIGFVSAIPYLLAAVALYANGKLSDRAQERHLHAAVPCFISALGFACSLVAHSPIAAIAALTAATMVFARNPPFLVLPGSYLSGPSAAVGIALVTGVGSLGGFLGPYAVGLARGASSSFQGGLLILAVAAMAAGLFVLILRPGKREQSASSQSGVHS